ncbi:CRISPR-associated negative autoregulator DevR/Csa2 [Clostridium saccharobutylicum]|uniref:type I-B CRISPR-associated protein Cas7/Cst2/DevR n=1 Tax=Clostridium saccharobutylicum TaxID=169679 RepID=UPI0009838F22|nr:type I-B CRISPR-associated protein Cas7/Cst2/DevR [Clostridium saccharobutylicum]AQS10331.1 CRISPR-associated negative autoregulator DevR/Csa2 [Clostridium saccharobutylicum]MBC2438702.1 type I-B CRISPR-associated protein Cas7/Cst2/DevR [Clostridium saccharobutylicum]NSB87728.1 CRISPR-associated protein Cst2 [Clostridium saccharobutylicum]NYC31270.1 CRISPR-associated protein Cst2 [Clostridium saccharobutylicum]OOM19193.1 CRISPR-associated negative autoregulator DevR/Csa2 [Clostridium saccha
MENKGLTISMIFEAESANYGESVGNVTALKKISRGSGDSYSYISRQAMRYNIINQMGVDTTPIKPDKEVLQFHPDATIEKYPEIDFFGYMKTVKPVRTRSAVVRLSNAVALETFNADTEFLTNKGLLDRYNGSAEDKDKKDGGNIAQSEIHKSYYAYTITIDLDKVGIDTNDNIEISNEEKKNRVNKLLDTIIFLYRDIRGRRENLSPILAVGGVYSIKNPFFENRLKVKNNKVSVETIEEILNLHEEVKTQTKVGLIKGIFNNDNVIEEKLNTIEMSSFFKGLKEKIEEYYK